MHRKASDAEATQIAAANHRTKNTLKHLIAIRATIMRGLTLLEITNQFHPRKGGRALIDSISENIVRQQNSIGVELRPWWNW
jgi:hypothetical protein